MIRILFIYTPLEKGSRGGTFRSSFNILEGFKDNPDFEIRMLPFNPETLLSRFFNFMKLWNFFFIPKIIKVINSFKPHAIMSQSGAAFPSIISAKIKGIPMINIIRDISFICPKNVDITHYGKACEGLINKKTCFNCINYWRTLRVLINNKPKGYQNTFLAIASTIYYKIRYPICRLNLILYNRATINVIASELIQKFLSKGIKTNKLKVLNITPIKNVTFPISTKKKTNYYL